MNFLNLHDEQLKKLKNMKSTLKFLRALLSLPTERNSYMKPNESKPILILTILALRFPPKIYLENPTRVLINELGLQTPTSPTSINSSKDNITMKVPLAIGWHLSIQRIFPHPNGITSSRVEPLTSRFILQRIVEASIRVSKFSFSRHTCIKLLKVYFIRHYVLSVYRFSSIDILMR